MGNLAFKFTGYQAVEKGIHLVIPNILGLEEAKILLNHCSGRRVFFLVDEDSIVDDSLELFLNEKDINALQFSSSKDDSSQINDYLQSELKGDDLCIFIPGLVKSNKEGVFTLLKKQVDFLLSLNFSSVTLHISRASEVATSIEFSRKSKKNDMIYLSFGRKLAKLNDLEASLYDDKIASVRYAQYQESRMLACMEAFSANISLDISLTYAVLCSLKIHGKLAFIYDGLLSHKYSYQKLLAISVTFAYYLKRITKKKRVGIVLPNGVGSIISNLAVIFADKIPVNINFTSSVPSIKSSIKQADIDYLITVDKFMKKLSGFPWPKESDNKNESLKLLLVNNVLSKLKTKIFFRLLINKISSAPKIASRLGLSAVGGHKEAVLLFTSGSSGEPKGVPLTHRNLIANIKQVTNKLGFSNGQSILGSLPIFHSFGSTVTLWYPLLEGLNIITYPSPLEIKSLAKLIEKFKIALLIATPTFLKGYILKAQEKQLESLKMIITGAEKLPMKLSKSFEQKFKKTVLEGYGLTETSPVVSANFINPSGEESKLIKSEKSLPVIQTLKPGSVGRIFPGIAIRIIDESTKMPKLVNEQGLICLKGDNVFLGYLNKVELNSKIIKDNWFITGDIGYLDQDGFLHISGRTSRFSKIGGEMVPHETIENFILSKFNIDESKEKMIYVVGSKKDEEREELILLIVKSCKKINTDEIRSKLNKSGYPNLWVPKKIVRVDAIPTLASGKIDIQQCNNLANKK